MPDDADQPLAPAAPRRAAFTEVSTLLLALAAVALGYAIHVRDGEYWPSAIRWVAAALVACVAAVSLARSRDRGWRGQALLVALIAIYCFHFYQLFRSPPGGWNWWSDDLRDTTPANLRLYYLGLLAAALFTGLCLLDRPRLRAACVPLLIAAHLLLGAWMVRSSPRPNIDVFYFQQEGARALLAGKNPYAVPMPDIYAGTAQERDRAVYGEGLSKGGRLDFGFPYTPLSLLLAAAGFVIAGDHRWAQLVAMTLAGALVAYCRPGLVKGSPARVAAAAGALLLFTPRAFFILGRGWTEPVVALGLAATVFVACRFPPTTRRRLVLLAVVLGLFLATKQYLIFAAPAALLLVPPPFTARKALTLFGVAALVAALVTAPLALWDVRAFVHSVGTVQKVAPFREDALSFLVWFYQKTGHKPGAGAFWLAAGVMAPAIALALCRCPRGPAGFAAAIAVTYLPFIAFNKQAFANYYYFVIAALWCAVAATPGVADARCPPLPPGEDGGEGERGDA
jgi:hypothetical protein